MTMMIENLTPAQLARVYNHHTDKPIAKFENRAKGARRLLALLAQIEVAPADAIAAAIPDAAQQAAMVTEAPAPEPAPAAAPTTKPRLHRSGLDRTMLRMPIAEAPAQVEPPTPASAPAPAVTGKARTLIADATSRAQGATSAELFEITGWKYASWSHQMKLITKATGTPHEIRKVDGTTRYFLTA